jgi:hypothetical protein
MKYIVYGNFFIHINQICTGRIYIIFSFINANHELCYFTYHRTTCLHTPLISTARHISESSLRGLVLPDPLSNHHPDLRFQVLTAVSMKITAFWDIAPCSLGADQRIRDAYCLHHQGDESCWSTPRLHGTKAVIFIILMSFFVPYAFIPRSFGLRIFTLLSKPILS